MRRWNLVSCLFGGLLVGLGSAACGGDDPRPFPGPIPGLNKTPYSFTITYSKYGETVHDFYTDGSSKIALGLEASTWVNVFGLQDPVESDFEVREQWGGVNFTITGDTPEAQALEEISIYETAGVELFLTAQGNTGRDWYYSSAIALVADNSFPPPGMVIPPDLTVYASLLESDVDPWAPANELQNQHARDSYGSKRQILLGHEYCIQMALYFDHTKMNENIPDPPPGNPGQYFYGANGWMTANYTMKIGPNCCEHRRKIVFVTDVSYQGNVGGIAGADAICQAEADSAGLSGTFKAWFSDSTTSPDNSFTKTPGPYRLVDGTLVAADWHDLIDGTLEAAIDVTASGRPIISSRPLSAWTNTVFNGSNAYPETDLNCGGGTHDGDGQNGLVGAIKLLDSGWTKFQLVSCDQFARFYCFEQ